jgi:putative transposase
MNELQKVNPERKHPVHIPSVEQFNRPVIIFLTVCSSRHRRILANSRVHQALLESWALAEQWHVGKFVIMPDHIHLFCSPAQRDVENVACWTAYWKRLISVHLSDLKPIWQRDCWDTQLRGHENYEAKWNYVRNNPVRAGLVKHAEEWPFQGLMHCLRW